MANRFTFGNTPSGPRDGKGRVFTPVPTPVTGGVGEKGDTGEPGKDGLHGPKGDPGKDGLQGASGPMGGALTIVAAQVIPAFNAITASGALADSSDSSHYGKVVGVTKNDVTTGLPVDVAQVGELQNLSWVWVAGQSIFLNGTSLASSSPISGFIQKIGVAKNSTTIVVELEAPILL